MNQKILWMTAALLAVGLAVLGCRSGRVGPIGIEARPDYRLRTAEPDMARSDPDGGAATAGAGLPLEPEIVKGIQMQPPVGTPMEGSPNPGKKRPKPTYGGPPSP